MKLGRMVEQNALSRPYIDQAAALKRGLVGEHSIGLENSLARYTVIIYL